MKKATKIADSVLGKHPNAAEDEACPKNGRRREHRAALFRFRYISARHLAQSPETGYNTVSDPNRKDEAEMEKFIPYEKLSKREKRAQDRRGRTLWTRSPVTRRTENPRAYDRRKARRLPPDGGEALRAF